MQEIKDFVKNNSTILFKCYNENPLEAIFDQKGFFFSDETHNIYNAIKNEPHLYVAWMNTQDKHMYIGKSNQNGGRWKRSHAYHLGTLAHHFFDNIKKDDQNHAHWIDNWMNRGLMQEVNDGIYSVPLKSEVYICFIPFSVYSNLDYLTTGNPSVSDINKQVEQMLIESYRNDGAKLLNVQLNKKTINLTIVKNNGDRPRLNDFENDFLEKKIHLVCPASNGLTTFNVFACIIGKMSSEEANQMVDLVNEKNETGTLYPKLNLTIVPVTNDNGRNDTGNKKIIRKHILDCFESNEKYIKCSKLIFALDYHHCDQETYFNELVQIVSEKNFVYTKEILFYK